MIKKNQSYFNWINRLTDMAIIFLSYLFAVWFWFFLLHHDSGNVAVQFARDERFSIMIVSLVYVVVFQYEGMYDSQRFGRLWRELVHLLKSFALCTVLVMGGIFLLKITNFSRGVVIIFGAAACLGLSLKRLLLRVGLRIARKKGYNQKHMLVVGCGPLARKDVVGSMRLINIRSNPQDIIFNRVLKRTFDIVFSSTAILQTSPLLLFIALCVCLSSPGPVLFRQERVGRDRKHFIMFKFRSMYVNEESETAWSHQRDPRVTGFGAFIRKFSLDELPQFFNVLKGDMSVVGPRPELPYFVEKYKYEIPRYMVKHQVKPGITGLAQVYGYRGDTSIEKRVEYDLRYIENWSFGLDIKIILMTIFGGMMNTEKNLSRDKQEQNV